MQCKHARTILRNKSLGQSLFKKHSKCKNFLLNKFILTRSNEGKMNSVRFDMAYSIELKFLSKLTF